MTRKVWFKNTRQGRRAYYWSTAAMRALPISVAKAEIEIATGEAEQVDCSPLDL